ncbi:S-formylglutathione hydrolase [Thiotrichales bacterium 19S11-10]|nr:S-formylglutathione hydrolase [Thiotrichales bacterium 19S11-10]
MSLTLISENKCFDGLLKRFEHQSDVLNCQMTFSIYLPPQYEQKKTPLLWWLSGLTCTDENFMQKASAFKKASELGLAIIAPDTSPRGDGIPDDKEKAYDFGLGAGFYLNATKAPWSKNYHMYNYIVNELPALIYKNFNLSKKQAISGHSMGGHGAITIALKNPHKYTSVSAFSPICNPTQVPWGKKAFSNYLGDDQSSWQAYDSTLLMKDLSTCDGCLPLLVDQGDKDQFLADQLKPEKLIESAKKNNYPLQFRYQSGYDHSYYFISTFIDEHLDFHWQYLSSHD